MELTSYLLGKKANGGQEPTGTIEITENGTYDVKDKASANVNVSSGGGGDLSEYFITQIDKNTSSATGNYYQNLVKKTAPLELSSNVTSLVYCFYQNQVDEIQFDKEKFNTSNVTEMAGMFNYSKVKKLDLSGFNTNNVTDFANMFAGCEELKELDISSFSFQSNSRIVNMFNNCYKLAKLDMSGAVIVPSGQNRLQAFKNMGRDCLQSDGAYADGIPYVYVNNESVRDNILNNKSMWSIPDTWTTANVIVKGSE